MRLNNSETILLPAPVSVEKLSFTKLVPGAKMVGDWLSTLCHFVTEQGHAAPCT